jgi:hypothetical protein
MDRRGFLSDLAFALRDKVRRSHSRDLVERGPPRDEPAERIVAEATLGHVVL